MARIFFLLCLFLPNPCSTFRLDRSKSRALKRHDEQQTDSLKTLVESERVARYTRYASYCNRSARFAQSREFKQPPPVLDMLADRAKEILQQAPEKHTQAVAMNTEFNKQRKAGEGKAESLELFRKVCLAKKINTHAPAILVEIGAMIEAAAAIVQGVKDFKEQIADFGKQGDKIVANSSAKQDRREADLYTKMAENELTMIDGVIETQDKIIETYGQAVEINTALNADLDADHSRMVKEEMDAAGNESAQELDPAVQEMKARLEEQRKKETFVKGMVGDAVAEDSHSWRVNVVHAFAMSLRNVKAHKHSLVSRKANLVRKYVTKDREAWNRSSPKYLPIMVDDKPLMPQMHGTGVNWFKAFGEDKAQTFLTKLLHQNVLALAAADEIITKGEFDSEEEYMSLLDKQDQQASIIENIKVLQLKIAEMWSSIEHYQRQMTAYFRSCNTARRKVRIDRMKDRYDNKTQLDAAKEDLKKRQNDFELSKLAEIRRVYNDMFGKAKDVQVKMPDATQFSDPSLNPYVESFAALPTSPHLMKGVMDKCLEMHKWVNNELDKDMMSSEYETGHDLRLDIIDIDKQDSQLLKACDSVPALSKGPSIVALDDGGLTRQSGVSVQETSMREPPRPSGMSGAGGSMVEPRLSSVKEPSGMARTSNISGMEMLPVSAHSASGHSAIVSQPNSGIERLPVASGASGRTTAVSQHSAIERLPVTSGVSGRTTAVSQHSAIERLPVTSGASGKTTAVSQRRSEIDDLPVAISGASGRTTAMSGMIIEDGPSRQQGVIEAKLEASVREAVALSMPVVVSDDPNAWPTKEDKSGWFCDERLKQDCEDPKFPTRYGDMCVFIPQKGKNNGFWQDGVGNELGTCVKMKNGGKLGAHGANNIFQ